VREAMVAGLDRDDTIVRRRLRQKLEFLVEDVAGAAAPTEQELQAWLNEHADAFRIEPQVAFRQVYINRDRRRASAEADAGKILARVRAAGPAARIDELGDPIMLPQEIELAPRCEVARTFGSEFAERIQSIATETWTGPIESGYGLHLVMVRERVEGSLPNLAVMRPAVEREFLADRRTRQVTAMYERLLQKYMVIVEIPEGDKAADGAGKGGS